MLLLVPDEYRAEVLNSNEQDLQDLRTACVLLVERGRTADEIAAKLETAGWSKVFSDWYAGQLHLYGPDLELRVSRKTKFQEGAEIYEAGVKRKRLLTVSGWTMVLASILVRRLSAGIVATIGPRTSSDLDTAVALITIGGWLVAVFLSFKGLFNVLDAKAQSRWWSLIGVFVVFVRDNNILVAPHNPTTEKPSAVALSDW